MADRFIVFDVETPNSLNDRMSALGITVLEKGRVAEEFYTLIDPQTWFARFNVELTGISPADVADSPTFPEVWEAARPLMESGILAAHNAPFDMGVLSKCLKAYGIPSPRHFPYVCTCRMGRRMCPDFPNHRLDTMCSRFGIDLSHHNAGSDAHAAAMLLKKYTDMGADAADFIRTYDVKECRTLPAAESTRDLYNCRK